jgi:SAM-dependent methyltransferase
MAEYDAIAEEYSASKFLPWRLEVERPTLFGLVGDAEARAILDLACGDGIYARMLAGVGASRVHGVDLSEAMIQRARAQESRRPCGATYEVGDAASLGDVGGVSGAFDLVLAAYLLNYAQDRAQLLAFARTAASNLRPGGRLVGVNDNPRNALDRYGDLWEHGLSREIDPPRREGTRIRYTIRPGPDESFCFDNFWLSPQTYESVFEEAGFESFRFVDAHPSRPELADDPFYAGFLADCPICGLEARMPA